MKMLNHLGDDNMLKHKSVNPENEIKSTKIQEIFDMNKENHQENNNIMQPR